MNPALVQFLTMLIPIIAGIATVPLFNAIKNLSTSIDKLPDPIKQLLVIVLAWALNQISSLLHITLPTSINGLDSTAVGTLISSALAFLLHLAQQTSQVKTTLAAASVIAASSVTVNPVQAPK